MMWLFIESEFQTGFITANIIIAKLYFSCVASIVLTKATKGIALWSIKIFFQNLRYKHKKNIKTPK